MEKLRHQANIKLRLIINRGCAFLPSNPDMLPVIGTLHHLFHGKQLKMLNPSFARLQINGTN